MSFQDWAVDQFCLEKDAERFLFGGSIYYISAPHYDKNRTRIWEKRISLPARLMVFWRMDQRYLFPVGLKWVARLLRFLACKVKFSLAAENTFEVYC